MEKSQEEMQEVYDAQVRKLLSHADDLRDAAKQIHQNHQQLVDQQKEEEA